MNVQEAGQLIATVHLLWPHSALGEPAGAVRVWQRMLRDVSLEEAEETVIALSAQGERHAPAPGVVVRMVAHRRMGLPEWDEVWTEVSRLIARVGRYATEDRTLGPPPRRAFSHPAIAAWAIPVWMELCDGPAPGTGDFGTFYAQAREAFRASAGRAEVRAAWDIAAVPEPRGELRRIGELTDGS